MKIVIVGSGWLGKPLAEKMWNLGHDVFAIYRSNKPMVSCAIAKAIDDTRSAIELIQSNDLDMLKMKLPHADAVVFCFPSPKEGKSHAEVCLDITQYCDPSCRFIFTSTTGVYPNENAEFDEQSILDPENKHVQTENQLRRELGNTLSIVRLAGLVGEGRFPVRMMSSSGKIYNADEYCNLIHLEDAVGFIAFLILENIRVEIVNACAPQHPAKGEYYTDMAEKLNVATPVFEKGPTGKLILSDLSISLGYEYLKPDPYDFY